MGFQSVTANGASHRLMSSTGARMIPPSLDSSPNVWLSSTSQVHFVPKQRLWSYPGGARRVPNSWKRGRDTFLTDLAPPALLGISLREATSLSATLSREASSTPKEPDPPTGNVTI
jgi:hypothetical protein